MASSAGVWFVFSVDDIFPVRTSFVLPWRDIYLSEAVALASLPRVMYHSHSIVSPNNTLDQIMETII